MNIRSQFLKLSTIGTTGVLEECAESTTASPCIASTNTGDLLSVIVPTVIINLTGDYMSELWSTLTIAEGVAVSWPTAVDSEGWASRCGQGKRQEDDVGKAKVDHFDENEDWFEVVEVWKDWEGWWYNLSWKDPAFYSLDSANIYYVVDIILTPSIRFQDDTAWYHVN